MRKSTFFGHILGFHVTNRVSHFIFESFELLEVSFILLGVNIDFHERNFQVVLDIAIDLFAYWPSQSL